ncbi:protein IQ-DOMAIN 1 [Phoenix dactylifera]|uniref:Protein IQ-DOMAIN 1 n=1 Tax=Phoenix dactylifera TaxID=42345 RepID=A0A8B7C0A7_PHODC|nr:protein IQ-DOMAIN 1 [Phoenix dactylifera]XP_026660301.2 protein IQ-DOMAIN 1 [Phoenix dactylifera]XP_038988968.1 protein IQ-DOMAIN 1 [Phoenix dactylifera]
MGRKAKWFGTIKKVFSPESREKKSEKSKKKSGYGNADPVPAPPPPPPSLPLNEEVKLAEAENEQNNHAHSGARATVASAEAAAEVVRLTTATRFSGKSREEVAAIKIQTAFRGYLARRALRALRGLVRLKSLIHENSVKRQATTTLRCMQTLARVQSQICSRRIRMQEENQALQRQLLLKREIELGNLRTEEEWDDSMQSKQQIEASLLSKQEAAIRRERALAYAFSHQWKNSSRSGNPMFMDPNNPHWGWSWLERWMASRPWESRSTTDRELSIDRASVKSTSHSVGGGEIMKAYARHDSNLDRPSHTTEKLSRPASRQFPSTPNSRASLVAGKIKSASPKTGWGLSEDDLRSVTSIQSERPRRHSLGGSSIRDDESLASSPAIPSYMVPTESARAKSRFQSPLNGKIETSDKGSAGSVKKRLSFPVGDKNSVTSPARVRRHSGPPKADIASIKDIQIHSDNNTGDGETS